MEAKDFASERIKIGQVVHEEVVGCGLVPCYVLVQLGTEGFLDFRVTGEFDEGPLDYKWVEVV
jgi:hypothetical protein